MRTDHGIQRRLIILLASGVVATALAGAVAILALTDLGRSFRVLAEYEVPSMVAGLDLARHGATIEGRGPSLIAAENEWERYRQATYLEQDFTSLGEALGRFKAVAPARASAEVGEIDAQVKRIRDALDATRIILGELAERQRAQRNALARLTKAQDALRQAFVPTLLALSRTISVGADEDVERIRFIAGIRDPLSQSERLLDASMTALLLVGDQRNVGELVVTRGHVERLFGQIETVSRTVPVGLRPAFERAVQEFRQSAAGTDGLIRSRVEELQARDRLAALVETNRAAGAALNFRIRRVLEVVRQDVGIANESITRSIAGHTWVLVAISLVTVLSTAAAAWFVVVRDLGRNLRAVTEAMMRLAAGERGVAVPAVRRTDELGALARAFSVFRENAVTLERVDQELRQKSEHLLATFENMNDGLSVFDLDERLVTWNAKFVELFDLPAALVAPGTPLSAILAHMEEAGASAFDGAGRPIPVRELLRARLEKPRQYEIHTPAGRIVELRGNPTPGGFVTVHTDRTQRRVIEARLVHAQKMEVVGRLAGGVAHDFNNILAVVVGNLHLLRDRLSGRPAEIERVDRALAAADRATTQIDRMLTFARRQALHPRLVDINELIAGMIDLIAVSLGDGIEVEVREAPDAPALMIDVAQMENALLNLAINARDAMPDGGKLTLSAWTRAAPDGARWVEVEVADTGCGMTPETATRAIEPFFTTKDGGRGNGLGLSMVYGFVKQSGGELRIDTAPGRGTRVGLTLPAFEGEGAAVPPEVVSRTGEPARSLDGIGVLVVEDAPDLLEVTAALLRSWGCRVATAERAELALAVLRDDRGIRVMLTDVCLREGPDGTALAREAAISRPDVVVLLTSAHSRESLSRTVAAPEVFDRSPLIGKPAPPDRLRGALLSALSDDVGHEKEPGSC